MKKLRYLLICWAAGFALHASAAPLSHDDAKKLWEQSKARSGYDQYSDEFAQFNNSHRLDEKGGCYMLDRALVTIYLVISHHAGEKFAVIEQVASDVDNAKAKCFKKTYTGVPTKVPPFVPIVLQMQMGG